MTGWIDAVEDDGDVGAEFADDVEGAWVFLGISLRGFCIRLLKFIQGAKAGLSADDSDGTRLTPY